MDLENIFQELNTEHFGSTLPIPELQWNSRFSTTAGRFGPGNRHRSSKRSNALIEVASYLKELERGKEHVRDTVLHEMIHFWLWYRRRPYGHTKEFYEKMRTTGSQRYNPVPKLRPIRHHYQCPHCKILIPARRTLKNLACYACCKKYNDGYYRAKYKLQLVEKPLPEPPAIEKRQTITNEQLDILRKIVTTAKIKTKES